MQTLTLPEPIAKYFTTVPFDTQDNDGVHVVRANVTGNFPGSPACLSYRFGLERGLIDSLEINV